MRTRGTVLGFVVYLIFGLYFLNSGLGFYQIPESFLTIHKWLSVVAGALLVVGGINFFRASRYY